MTEAATNNTTTIGRRLTVPDLERMNIPNTFWTTTIQKVQDPARVEVERYLRQIPGILADGAGLVLTGDRGVGKTSIAVLALKVARLNRLTGFFGSIADLRVLVRERIAFDEETSIIGRCREVGLLVLDDLCEEDFSPSSFWFKDIKALVKYRASYNKATIITVNQDVTATSLKALVELAKGTMIAIKVSGKNLLEERDALLKKRVK
jgi:DNA replication protein DnaC